MLRGYDANDIASILEFVISNDLQSEIRYVEMIVRSRATKGYGPSYITGYLKQKGVREDLIKISIFESEFDWDDVLLNLLVRKFGSDKISSSDTKAIRFLQSRGFTYKEFGRYLR